MSHYYVTWCLIFVLRLGAGDTFNNKKYAATALNCREPTMYYSYLQRAILVAIFSLSLVLSLPLEARAKKTIKKSREITLAIEVKH